MSPRSGKQSPSKRAAKPHSTTRPKPDGEAARDVFISYSTIDGPFVENLAKHLQSKGVSLWLDRFEIRPGDYLRARINDGIANAEYLVVVLSQHSINSEWVKHEVDAAMMRELDDKRVRLIPILWGSITPQDLPGDIRGKLFLDFRTDDKAGAALDRLIDLLKPEEKLRRQFLQELRAGFPTRRDPGGKLSEIIRENPDQTIQCAAIRGLLRIGTAPALLAIVERLYGVWGANTLRYCVRGLERFEGQLGLVALATTMFWDERFVAEKLNAFIRKLDDLSDIRDFVDQQSQDGKISLFSIMAAMQDHTTPEIAAAFDYSCHFLPRSTVLLMVKPIFSDEELAAKKDLLDKTIPGLSHLISFTLPALDQSRREIYRLKKMAVRLDPKGPDADDPLFVGS